MLYECSTLPRNPLARCRWADESREEVGAGQKALALLLSFGLAGVVTVAMPFALLHLR